MGCGGSKKKEKKGDFTMEPTGSDSADQMFNDMVGPFQTLGEVYQKLSKAIKKFKHSTSVNIVQGSNSGDAVLSMLYCCSAAVDGDLEKLELRVTDSSPFIALKRSQITNAHQQVLEDFENFIEALTSTPERLQPLPEQIQAAVDGLSQVQDRASSAVEELDMLGKVKAVKAIASNCAKISKGPQLLQDTQKVLADANAALQAACNSLKSDSEKERIKKLGKEAHKAGHTEPRPVVIHFWPEKEKVDLTLEKKKKK